MYVYMYLICLKPANYQQDIPVPVFSHNCTYPTKLNLRHWNISIVTLLKIPLLKISM